MGTITELSDVELADEITSWAGRGAAAEARLLAMIGEFDQREAWAGVGILSCAHWLTWRIGLGLPTAREKVRVARALRTLPALDRAFHAGQLSWSQVRAVTRVATPENEADYLDMARHSTAAQLERIVRGVRRAQLADEDAADPLQAAHRLRVTRSYDADGTFVLTIRASAQDGAVINAALEQVRADLDRQRRDQPPAEDTPPEAPAAPPADVSAETSTTATSDDDGPAAATQAEALLEMAQIILEHQAREHPDTARRHRSRLIAQIDPLSGWARLHDGEFLPPSALADALGTTSLADALSTRTGTRTRPPTQPPTVPSTVPLFAAGLRLRPLTPTDLTREDLGRTRREPSLALRELLGTIDGERCRMPGCTRTRKLHAHHVKYWSDQGPTDLANLVLVCSRHHTLIHQHGYQLTLHPDRTATATTADGVPVPHHPDLPWGDPSQLDPDHTITADTLPPRHDRSPHRPPLRRRRRHATGSLRAERARRLPIARTTAGTATR